MTCPACSSLVSIVDPIADLVICPQCLASIMVSTGQRATSSETLPLSAVDLEKIKKKRAELRRARVA